VIVPDYVEPVVAWRVWYAVDGGLSASLTSIVHRAYWPRGAPLEATCRRMRYGVWPFSRSKHDAPAEGCRCGIYAGRLDTLRPYLPDCYVADMELPVIGRVLLWGVVHEHELGWRAAKAYPETLYVPTLSPAAERLVRHLSGYGVPVQPVSAKSADELLDAVGAKIAA
jgi:hypothetical protein